MSIILQEDSVKNINKKNLKNTEKKKILLIEDSQVVQNITKHVLGFHDYTVDTTIDGKEALERIKNVDYDIALMDIAMPNMDGIECIRKIRTISNEKKSKIPVVAVTGNAEFYTETEFKKAGFDDYIEKPVDFDSMSRVLKKFL